jgi:endonuclease YncB( thermonuclease family)
MRTIRLVIVIALVVTACSPTSRTPDRTPGPRDLGRSTTLPDETTDATSPPTTITQPTDSEEATVIDVYDGDSMLVEVNGRRKEVRLRGINAPENDECFGTDAGDRLRELAGSTVWLIADGEDTDRFGRLLRLVFTPTSFVNADLVEGGYALGLQDGSTLSAKMKQLEQEAFEGALGMWGWDVCGTVPSDLGISNLQPNAPGPDDENLVEEWIEISNNNADSANLGGFIVRDESSTHRFSFPAGFTLAAGSVVRLHTGCGQDTEQDVYWCNDTPVWNNGGDTVILQTPDGAVVDRLEYAGS